MKTNCAPMLPSDRGRHFFIYLAICPILAEF